MDRRTDAGTGGKRWENGIEKSLQHYQTYRLALRNGLFHRLKRTVWRCETDRFGTPNGMYL
jgi:hypothetical protein